MCVKHKQNWNAEGLKQRTDNKPGIAEKKQRAEGKLDKYL